MSMIAMERGDSQLHIHGVLSIKVSITRSLKADISTAIGWKENGPLGGSICVKKITYTIRKIGGLAGYCLKVEVKDKPGTPKSDPDPMDLDLVNRIDIVHVDELK
ncbi:hypothetical protein R1sor_003159 [Riccia sorocarpa]|uniref:Uncharacterized protein n=1 Tax=Riccia sorocarpa TaxID=122646 RepID=A0ABD3H3H2_9MARC